MCEGIVKEYNLNAAPANSSSDQQMESGWRKGKKN